VACQAGGTPLVFRGLPPWHLILQRHLCRRVLRLHVRTLRHATPFLRRAAFSQVQLPANVAVLPGRIVTGADGSPEGVATVPILYALTSCPCARTDILADFLIFRIAWTMLRTYHTRSKNSSIASTISASVL
jgi:hypothetical protein